MKKKFDLVVIGSGSGLMVIEAALAKGLNCALVEKEKIGGTCLTKGCIPSKMLVYPADFVRETQRSTRFGMMATTPQIDWDHISRRMWKQINFSETIEENLLKTQGLTVFKGSAAFVGPKEVKITSTTGEQVIEGEKILIATGAKSRKPKIQGIEEIGYITSETFFGPAYPEEPWDSLTILGGGAIAMEFAHIFSAFGTKVTVVVRGDRILRKEDKEISDFLERQLVSAGVNIVKNAKIEQAYNSGDGKSLKITSAKTGEESIVTSQEILAAIGSDSTGSDLDLEKAMIETDKDGWIPTNQYLETNQPNIWAIGDVNGKYQLRHKANHEAQVLIHNLFEGKDKKSASYVATPLGIFTNPQIGRVGATEEELIEREVSYKVVKNYFSAIIGGRSMGINQRDEDNGFVKVLIGEDKKILGVHIVGPHAIPLIQPFVHIINEGAWAGLSEGSGSRVTPGTYEIFQESMVIHPSLSELTAWVFEGLS